MQTITATIEGIVSRGKNTRNGNPNLTVEILTASEPFPGRTTIKVAGDTSLSFSILNGEYQDGEPRTFAVSRGRLLHEVR